MQTCSHSPNWIKIYGETYHRSEFVICGFQEDDLPIFGRIDAIMVITGTPIFSLRIFRTLGLSNHLLCYAIERLHKTSLVLLSQLMHKEPLTPHQRTGDDNVYITLRFHVINTANEELFYYIKMLHNI